MSRGGRPAPGYLSGRTAKRHCPQPAERLICIVGGDESREGFSFGIARHLLVEREQRRPDGRVGVLWLVCRADFQSDARCRSDATEILHRRAMFGKGRALAMHGPAANQDARVTAEVTARRAPTPLWGRTASSRTAQVARQVTITSRARGRPRGVPSGGTANSTTDSPGYQVSISLCGPPDHCPLACALRLQHLLRHINTVTVTVTLTFTGGGYRRSCCSGSGESLISSCSGLDRTLKNANA